MGRSNRWLHRPTPLTDPEESNSTSSEAAAPSGDATRSRSRSPRCAKTCPFEHADSAKLSEDELVPSTAPSTERQTSETNDWIAIQEYGPQTLEDFLAEEDAVVQTHGPQTLEEFIAEVTVMTSSSPQSDATGGTYYIVLRELDVDDVMMTLSVRGSTTAQSIVDDIAVIYDIDVDLITLFLPTVATLSPIPVTSTLADLGFPEELYVDITENPPWEDADAEIMQDRDADAVGGWTRLNGG